MTVWIPIVGAVAEGSRVLADGRVLIRIGRHEIPFTRELYEDALQEQTWDELVASLPKEAE